MVFVIWIIWVIVLILLVFLYSIWKDEDTNNDDKILSEWEILHTVKIASLDDKYFRLWIKDIKIINEDFNKLKNELWKKIIWMDEFVNSIIVNILVWWHLLVEWVPWLAKTKTIETLAEILDMDFVRTQFTPDMLPSDIIWVEIYNPKKQEFEVKRWMVFTNIFLADEINRTTPKVQSALLEAMQEKKVSLGGEDFNLPNPFFVLATQNPLEQEWTYPLPEAQIDRFLFKVLVDYPNKIEEKKMLDILEYEQEIKLSKIVTRKKFIEYQKLMNEVVVSQEIKDYITRLVDITRIKDKRVTYGASPRASIGLMFASKALAFLQWREFVIHEDIQRLAVAVMRHRIILSYDAKVDWLTEDQYLLDVLAKVTLE